MWTGFKSSKPEAAQETNSHCRLQGLCSFEIVELRRKVVKQILHDRQMLSVPTVNKLFIRTGHHSSKYCSFSGQSFTIIPRIANRVGSELWNEIVKYLLVVYITQMT